MRLVSQESQAQAELHGLFRNPRLNPGQGDCLDLLYVARGMDLVLVAVWDRSKAFSSRMKGVWVRLRRSMSGIIGNRDTYLDPQDQVRQRSRRICLPVPLKVPRF